MKLTELQRHWNGMGEVDPLFAILTRPGKKGNRWQREEFLETGRGAVQLILDWISSTGTQLRHGRALDFGCGAGRLTQALCQHFQYVDGVDIARSMLDKARAWNACPHRCTYHHNEQPDLQLFPSGEFDFICTLITLQHMEPDFAVGYIREFARLLAPGGVLVFQVPDSLAQQPPQSTPAAPSLPRPKFLRTPRIIKKLKQWLDARRDKPGYFVGKSEEFWMEMHCVPEARVVQTLRECGLDVAAIQRDQSAGEHFVSKRYMARRPG